MNSKLGKGSVFYFDCPITDSMHLLDHINQEDILKSNICIANLIAWHIPNFEDSGCPANDVKLGAFEENCTAIRTIVIWQI